MNEQRKKIFQMLAQSAKAVGQFIKDCNEQEDWLAAQRVATMRQYQQEQFRASLKIDYDNFIDAVGRCLRRNHSQCCLFDPKCREEIECEEEQYNIDGDYNNVIFRYEVEREPIGANMHTICQGRVKCVPVEEIERRLQSELPKYTRAKCYGFRRLSVTDIGKNKIRIEAEGVYRLNPEGMMVW